MTERKPGRRDARLISLPEGVQVMRDSKIRYYWYNQITDTSRHRLWKLMDQCLQLASNSAIHIWRRRSEMEHKESNKQRMTMQEKRSIALGAARSQLRRIGVSLDRPVPFDNVLRVLDDLHRAEPDLVASQWYAHASEYQITQLRRDWKRQFAPTRRTTRNQRM